MPISTSRARSAAIGSHGERDADQLFDLEGAADADGDHFAQAVAEGELCGVVVDVEDLFEQAELRHLDGDDQRDRLAVTLERRLGVGFDQRG